MEPSKKFAITLLEALEFEVEEVPETDEAVSYTHLTLPTIYSV